MERGQGWEEGRRKKKRSEDGRLMRRRWKKLGKGSGEKERGFASSVKGVERGDVPRCCGCRTRDGRKRSLLRRARVPEGRRRRERESERKRKVDFKTATNRGKR